MVERGQHFLDVPNIVSCNFNSSFLDMEFAAAVNEAADADLSVRFPDCNGILIINALLCTALSL